MTINCSFCGKEIRRDRYNLALEIERQDAPSGNWSKSYEHAKEDVCGTCFELINQYVGYIMWNIRKNKGKFVAQK